MVAPVYFSRDVREVIRIPLENALFLESKGFEPYDNYCGGAAEKEMTKAHLKLESGKIIEVTCRWSFHWVYDHVFKEALDVVK